MIDGAKAQAIADIRAFLEHVQWQGKTGFNMREREMEHGATKALAALLLLETSPPVPPEDK